MFDNISDERKNELENIALKYRKIILERYGSTLYISPSDMLIRSRDLYLKEHKENINGEEEKLFLLHIVLPDDTSFINKLRQLHYNKEKFSKLYSVPTSFVRARYKYILEKNRKKLYEMEAINNSNILEKTIK